ncbi:MAG TPA: arginine--tRNA ligase [Candidatus Saccharibacteria bacterium]|nr:arginine--tRNA ligase [Candidatus Saccharibacteria bacterium]HMT39527.1 arginine--tRNA ligase [Candidatus Saccharibacteria bacterium]
MKSLKSEVYDIVASIFVELFSIDPVEFNVDYCDLKYGHFACNVALTNSKNLKLNPVVAANQLVKNLKDDDWIKNVEVQKPGFINITLKDKILLEALYNRYPDEIRQYIEMSGTNQTVVIDYSHPNIGKPMSVHHLLSTVIGDAIKLIYKDTGHNVIADNFVGDMGTQFGKLIYAIKTWGDMQAIEDNPVPELLALYVKYHVESEKNPELDDFARLEYKKIEDNDSENRALLTKVQAWSMAEMEMIYRLLGVEFDYYHGESFYEDKLKDIVDLGIKKGIFVKSEGALVCESDNPDDPPALIQKKDGTSLYLTRDLARVAYWEQQWQPSIMINVVDVAQTLQMSQVYSVSKKLGLTDARNIHVVFGRMEFKDKSMSTRRGNVIFITDLIDETKRRVLSQIVSLSKSLSRDDQVQLTDILAINSIKYNILKQNRSSSIIFDWDNMLNIEGNSAPYLAYTAVRMQSIIRKSEGYIDKSDSTNSKALEELELAEIKLILHVDKLAESYHEAKNNFQPSILASYCYDICRLYNSWYNSYKIIEESDAKPHRIRLNCLTLKVVKQCFESLGLRIPNKM